MKTSMSEIFLIIILDGINGRLYVAEVNTSKLEHIEMETIQNETQRENSTISLIILSMDELKTPNKGKDRLDKNIKDQL